MGDTYHEDHLHGESGECVLIRDLINLPKNNMENENKEDKEYERSEALAHEYQDLQQEERGYRKPEKTREELIAENIKPF